MKLLSLLSRRRKPDTRRSQPPDYFTCVMDVEHTQRLRTKRVSFDETTCTELEALNTLKDPAAARPPPSDKSIAAFQYLSLFHANIALSISLLEAILALGNAVGSDTTPSFVKSIFTELDNSMNEAFRAMSNLLAGIFFLPGFAGCGKSYMMEMTILFSQFGSCLTNAEPHDVVPDIGQGAVPAQQ